MNILELGLFIGAVALPFPLLIAYEFHMRRNPRILRDEGVVVLSDDILEKVAAPIGTYMGHAIWARVNFMGLHYRYDRIAPRSYRNFVRPRELFLEPGLVYLTD